MGVVWHFGSHILTHFSPFFSPRSKTALTETLEIDQYMWAILNTLSGNQEVEEVVIDNSANWTPLRLGGNGGMLEGGNQMNPNPSQPAVPAIKVSIKVKSSGLWTRRLNCVFSPPQSEPNPLGGGEMDSKQFSNKVMSPGSTTLPTWDNSQAMSPYMMCPDMSSIASGSMMNK